MNLIFGNLQLNANIIYQTDFQNLNDFWWEGTPRVYAENNQLHLKCDFQQNNNGQQEHASSVFLNKKFHGNILVEFDGYSFHEESHRNFNFFIHTQLMNGSDLYETRAERTGSYSEYHEMENYLFTVLPSDENENLNADGSNKFRIRMRRNPGFTLRKEAHSYICENWRWYHFQYLINNGQITVCIDNLPQETYTWLDETALTEGYLGFRSFMSWLTFKNFKVYQI